MEQRNGGMFVLHYVICIIYTQDYYHNFVYSKKIMFQQLNKKLRGNTSKLQMTVSYSFETKNTVF